MLHSHPAAPLRKEILVYLRSCEDFLTFAAAHNASFSPEEQDAIEYYTAEVTKTLVPPGK